MRVTKSNHGVSQSKLSKKTCVKRQVVLVYGTSFNMKTKWLFIIFFEIGASSETLLSQKVRMDKHGKLLECTQSLY